MLPATRGPHRGQVPSLPASRVNATTTTAGRATRRQASVPASTTRRETTARRASPGGTETPSTGLHVSTVYQGQGPLLAERAVPSGQEHYMMLKLTRVQLCFCVPVCGISALQDIQRSCCCVFASHPVPEGVGVSCCVVCGQPWLGPPYTRHRLWHHGCTASGSGSAVPE